jgi:hypothetical protein
LVVSGDTCREVQPSRLLAWTREIARGLECAGQNSRLPARLPIQPRNRLHVRICEPLTTALSLCSLLVGLTSFTLLDPVPAHPSRNDTLKFNFVTKGCSEAFFGLNPGIRFGATKKWQRSRRKSLRSREMFENSPLRTFPPFFSIVIDSSQSQSSTAGPCHSSGLAREDDTGPRCSTISTMRRSYFSRILLGVERAR